MSVSSSLASSFICALLLLAACGGDPEAPAAPRLEILQPQNGDTLSGVSALWLKQEPPVALSGMSLQLDDGDWIAIERPDAYLALPTLDYENGDHRLSAAVDTAAGEHLEASVDVVIDNPEQRLLSYEGGGVPVSNGQTLSLDLQYSADGLELSADLSELDSGFSASALQIQPLPNGLYRLSYPISRGNRAADGTHRIAIAAADAAGRTNVDTLSIELRKLPRLPITVREGTFVDAPLPVPTEVAKAAAPGSSAGVPSITSVDGAGILPVGAELPLTVSWTQAAANAVDRVLVSADGFSGFFVVPVKDGVAKLSVGLPAVAQVQPSAPISISVAAVARDGSSSGWVSRSITPLPLPTSGVMVTLFWDTKADLDLTMHTPLGNYIDFDTRSADGGNLNLDANSQCKGSLVSTENVSWPPAGVLQGRHEVYVNIHDSCGAPSTNWTAIAQYCGQVTVVSGTFTQSDVVPNADGKLVLPFDVECTQRISGKIEYQSLASSGSFYQPAPFVPVSAVPVGGGAPLATALTNGSGEYTLLFTNPGLRDVAIEVETSWADPATGEVQVTVAPVSGSAAVRLRAPDTVASLDENAVVNWRVDRAHGAGALSVLNTLRRAYSWTLAHLPSGLTLGGLRARWAQNPAQSPFTHYDPKQREVYISSAPDSIDDFDPSVIAHEFMHFVVHTQTGDEGPGGGHMYKTDPALALNEGAATALGQAALGSSEYISLGKYWQYQDLESVIRLNAELPAKLPSTFGTPEPVAKERFGTSDGTATGQVSEWLDAMIFWDMMDGTDSAEPHDTLSNDTLGLTYSLLVYLSGSSPPDRGATGRDLTDALDGFLQYYGPAAFDGVLKLTEERGFPYLP